MSATIKIKGMRDGLLVTLGGGPWTELQESLFKQIEDKTSFFHGARLAVDVGSQVLHAADLGGLRDRLSEYGISLWAVIGNSPTTTQTAQVLGLATRLNADRAERIIRPVNTNLTGESAVLVQRTLRSGFRLTHPGHVVVIGDVNPGAEIVAGGSVVVWGRLSGVVHAGADGDEKAVVCALDLKPTQLRISDKIAISPQKKGKPQPEIASIHNGQVVAEFWNVRGK